MRPGLDLPEHVTDPSQRALVVGREWRWADESRTQEDPQGGGLAADRLRDQGILIDESIFMMASPLPSIAFSGAQVFRMKIFFASFLLNFSTPTL